jgi:hypothetical protein
MEIYSMRKLVLSISLTFIILTTSACGGGRDVYEVAFAPVPLTREQFLEDFDYLTHALEANFPYLGVIYRRNGVDMIKLAGELRELIADDGFDICHVAFWDLLRDEFFYHAWPIGHLWLVGYFEYQRYSEHFSRDYARFDTEIIQYFGNRLEVPPQVQGRLSHAFSTSVIDEGRIAYIRMPIFETLTMAEGRRIDTFYRGLEGFEHLIIDMRGSLGGWPWQFDIFVIEPLLDYYLQTEFHHFFMDGQHSYEFHRRLGGRIGGSPDEAGEFFSFDIDDVSEILPDMYLSADVIEDLTLMDFFFVETITVGRSGRARAPFYGKIWFLTDEYITSGTMQVAAFYKDVGFGTFVGEAGGGMPAGRHSSAHFALPNTNFIVRFDPSFFLDNSGRPLEYGFVPHFPNREGLDALETVLVMIEEES